MGEHLPCKQGVRGSNPLISIARELNENERKRSSSLAVGMSSQLARYSRAYKMTILYLENIIQKEIINSHLLLTRHLIKQSKR